MTSNFGYLSILLLLKMLTYMNYDILFITKKMKGFNFGERNLIKRKIKFSLNQNLMGRGNSFSGVRLGFVRLYG